MNKYVISFYFKAFTVLLLAAVFSACGREAADSERNYSTQITEATMSADTYKYVSQANTEVLHTPAFPDALQVNDHLSSAGKVKENVYLGKENIGGMSETELVAKLEQIAVKTDVSAVQAQYNDKTWAIQKEKDGKRLDIEKVKIAALSASSGKKIEKEYINVKPSVTSNQLENNVKLIAKFSTPLLDRSKSRIKNIRLAAKKIDHKIILPGQEFSFNDTTGRRSKKFGYEDATTIVNTPKGPKHVKAPGGGVCQLSTTIYNAVLKCNLNVTERHEHSDDVHYVPDGKDATVSYDWADFKFINNRNYPIMLRVYVGKKTVSVKILENSGLDKSKEDR